MASFGFKYLPGDPPQNDSGAKFGARFDNLAIEVQGAGFTYRVPWKSITRGDSKSGNLGLVLNGDLSGCSGLPDKTAAKPGTLLKLAINFKDNAAWLSEVNRYAEGA